MTLPTDSTPSTFPRASLEVPSDLGYLRPIRLTTAGLLASWDSDIHVMEDLRVAVTEACTMLWSNHGRAGLTRIVLELHDEEVELTVSLQGEPVLRAVPDAGSGSGFASDDIATALLEHLTDRYSYEPERRTIALAAKLRG